MISCKWPGLLIQGKPVSRELAEEIILRTSSWPLCSNAHDFDREVMKLSGIPNLYHLDEALAGMRESYETFKEAIKARKVLSLDYLCNHQISSAYVGGPHGWCSWGGQIGCQGTNIGKWPSEGDVLAELTEIAAAFPQLDMQVSLLDREWCDDGQAEFTDSWRVLEGKVADCEHPKFIPVNTRDFERDAFRLLTHPAHLRETGTTVSHLQSVFKRLEWAK